MGLRYAKLDDSDGCITRPQARTGWVGTDEPVQVRVRVLVGEPRVTRSGEGSWAGLARPLPENRLRLWARPRNRLAPGGCGCQSGAVPRTSPLRGSLELRHAPAAEACGGPARQNRGPLGGRVGDGSTKSAQQFVLFAASSPAQPLWPTTSAAQVLPQRVRYLFAAEGRLGVGSLRVVGRAERGDLPGARRVADRLFRQ